MARVCMQSLVALVLLASVALASPDRGAPLKFDDFAGPSVKPPVESGVARVVAPIQGSDWHGSLAIFEATVLRAEANALVVEGVNGEVVVPGAFVAPPNTSPVLKRGALVRYQERPGLFSSARLGRITKVAKTAGGVVYTIKAFVIAEVDSYDVPAALVRPVDGTLSMGAPVSFRIDGFLCVGYYVGAGTEPASAWVLSVGHAKQKTDVKPLVIKRFKKGAKVRGVFATTSVARLGVEREPRQYLDAGTVVEVIAGGLAYKVRADEGDAKGEVRELELHEVFAP